MRDSLSTFPDPNPKILFEVESIWPICAMNTICGPYDIEDRSSDSTVHYEKSDYF